MDFRSILGSHQTLLFCVPTSTLIATTRKILINTIRLLKFILQQFHSTPSIFIGTEKEYLKYIVDQLPELRTILDPRRIHLDKLPQPLPSFPVCIFHAYLLNGIDFLRYIHKIDGVYSTTKKLVVKDC